MNKMINLSLIAIAIILLGLTGYLVYYNNSSEVWAKILSVIIIGLGGIVTAISLGTNSTSSQKTYENVIFINGKKNIIYKPLGIKTPRFYEQILTPNASAMGKPLAYPMPAANLNNEQLFDFYGYINASILRQVFLQLTEFNSKLLNPDLYDVSYDEELNLNLLNIKMSKPNCFITIDYNSFESNSGQFNDPAIAFPDKVKVNFVAYHPSMSLSGLREVIIHRDKFFEFKLKSEVIRSAFGEKGFMKLKLTSSIKFEGLTSQHKMAKVYKAYCKYLTNLIETRFNNPKSLEDYVEEKPDLFN